MKKVILSAVLFTALLSSCTKEEKLEKCNCGLILSDDASDYSVNIKNDCSGNVKKWTLYPSDWYNAHVGSRYCITNTTYW